MVAVNHRLAAALERERVGHTIQPQQQQRGQGGEGEGERGEDVMCPAEPRGMGIVV